MNQVFDWILSTTISCDIIDACVDNMESKKDCSKILARPFQQVTGLDEFEESQLAMYGENL